jgi:hypothetical protein
VIGGDKVDVHSPANPEPEQRLLDKPKHRLFSRDLNYLRDSALFWPFAINSIIAVGSAFSPGNRDLALRCGAVAVTALLLAKERLFLFFVAVGFIAIRCAITLMLHPWSWSAFAAGILTGVPFLLANRYWRNPKLAYKFPKEMRLIDALWSVASLIGTLLVFYVIRPTQ